MENAYDILKGGKKRIIDRDKLIAIKEAMTHSRKTNVENAHNQFYDELVNTPEGRRRLKFIGLTPEDINKPELTFDNTGSKYKLGTDQGVNIDLEQTIDTYTTDGLGDMIIYDHEIGHALSDDLRRAEWQEMITKKLNNDPAFKEQMILEAQSKNMTLEKHLWEKLLPKYRSIFDDDLTDNVFAGEMNDVTPRAIKNQDYASYFSEPFPHLREMRQNIVDKGYTNHRWDEVTDEMLDDFIKNEKLKPEGKDRISSFIENSPEKRKKLLWYMNNFPSLVQTLVGGAATTTVLGSTLDGGTSGPRQSNDLQSGQGPEQKRQGGKTNPYLK
jgi:hypothetical protein